MTELAKCDNTTQTCEAVSYRKPAYSVKEEESGYTVRVEIPGVKKDDVEISLENDLLTIVGSRSDEIPSEWKYLTQELTREDYRLKLQLNVNVNEGGISAKVENGVLNLTLPIAEEAKPRQIKVE